MQRMIDQAEAYRCKQTVLAGPWGSLPPARRAVHRATVPERMLERAGALAGLRSNRSRRLAAQARYPQGDGPRASESLCRWLSETTDWATVVQRSQGNQRSQRFRGVDGPGASHGGRATHRWRSRSVASVQSVKSVVQILPRAVV